MFKNLVTRFFSYQYLFASPIQSPSRYDRFVLYFAAALVVLAIVFLIVRFSAKNPLQKELLRRWFSLTFYIGLLLAIWYGLRYELVGFLSLHFVAILIVVLGLVWLIYLIRYQCGKYRQARKDYDKEQLKRKYM